MSSLSLLSSKTQNITFNQDKFIIKNKTTLSLEFLQSKIYKP